MIDKTVSHYHILEKIGGGGMGVVYKAEDTKLRRTVALKFLAPELTRDEDAKRRFVHEAQAASALDHPNICSIYDIDETSEGQLYIAMACYDGESVKERIARRRIEVREAFEIAYSVAQGLARAHASGIIHRDIKPGNIMITQDGFVKIVDFGLAKLIGRSRITGSGATLGTIAYMSPEQARSEDSDARADIWALGVVLYEMLTGKLPFRGEIDQAVVYAILNEPPLPVQELRDDVPDSCADLVDRCMRKEPGQRYQSALELCDAIHRIAALEDWGSSFALGHISAVTRIPENRPRHRSRRPVLLGVTVGVGLAIAGPIGWRAIAEHTRNGRSTETRLAVMPLTRLGSSTSQAFVDGLSQWISEACDRVSRTRDSMWVLPYWLARTAPADMSRVADTFGVNRLLTGNVQPYRDGQRLTLVLSDANSLQPVDTSFVAFRSNNIDSLPSLLVHALVELFSVKSSDEAIYRLVGPTPAHGALSSYWEAIGFGQGSSAESLGRAYTLLNTTIALDSTFGPAFNARAQVMVARDKGPVSLDLASQDVSRALSIDSTYVPTVMWLASLKQQSGATEEAIALLERAQRLDPRCLSAYERLGDLLVSLARYDEAEVSYRQITKRWPDYYLGHYRMAWLFRHTHENQRELASYQRTLALAPEDFNALTGLGLYHADHGEWTKARELFERSFFLRPNCSTCSQAAWVLYYEGRFDDSAKYYEYALEYCDSTDFVHWGNLACALYWSEGKRDAGVQTYRHAISLAEGRLQREPDNQRAVSCLADYYAMIDDRENAKQMVERAQDWTDAKSNYRLACALEKLGEREPALDHVRTSLRAGYPLHEIKREPLFRDLVRDPRFEPLVQVATAKDDEDNASR